MLFGHRRIGSRLGALGGGLALGSTVFSCLIQASPARAEPEAAAALEALFGPDFLRAAPPARPILEHRLVARAQPDECFLQIGYPNPEPPCKGDYKPKVNQAYLWSGVRSGDHAYFGTGANILCLGSLYFGPLTGMVTDNVACEMAAGPAGRERGLVRLGDQRAPKIYRLDADTDKMEDVTPTDDPLLESTIGVRGAVSHQDVVIMGGPSLSPDGVVSLNLWAYEGSTGNLLGSTELPEYANMRRGLVVEDALYIAVRKAGGSLGSGGAILRWTGHKADPFRFEVVADLASEPAYVTEHQGRIVAAGWPNWESGKSVGEPAGVYLSPPVPQGGLTAKDAGAWQKIFSMDQYEPDPVVAQAAAFGDLISWRGKLYFSTMHLPGAQTVNAFAAYRRPESWLGRVNTYLNAERATAIFEMTDVGGSEQKVRLLYGEEKLPVYDTDRKVWVKKPNKLGQAPRFGASGFGNRFNYYSWRWTLFGDKLYMATFDASTAAPDTLPGMAAQIFDLPPLAVGLMQPFARRAFQQHAGADIWRMDSPDQPAVPEDTSGAGNRYNYGVRVWVSFEDKGKLYGGTANPFNLRTGPVEPGGWELILFTPRR